MKLFKNFTPNVAVYKNMTIDSAFESFKNSKKISLGSILSKSFEFSGGGGICRWFKKRICLSLFYSKL